MTDNNWMSQAACAGTDSSIWFPEKGESVNPGKKICNTQCPVRDICLNYAIDNGLVHGVWGGMTSTERTRHIRPHGTRHHYDIHKCRCRYCTNAIRRVREKNADRSQLKRARQRERDEAEPA